MTYPQMWMYHRCVSISYIAYYHFYNFKAHYGLAQFLNKMENKMLYYSKYDPLMTVTKMELFNLGFILVSYSILAAVLIRENYNSVVTTLVYLLITAISMIILLYTLIG